MPTSAQHYSRDLQRYYRMPATQVSLTLVLSLFIVAIFIIFALGPTLVAITTLQTTITDSQQTLQQLDTKINTLKVITTQFTAIKPTLSTLNLSIPNTGAAYSPLTMTIDALATQAGVSMESETVGSTLLYSRILAPFDPNKAQTVVALPLTIRVVGSYPQITQFLTQLLSIDRIVSLNTVTIAKSSSTKTGTTIVTLDVSGNAYYLADQAQLTKAFPTTKATTGGN